MPKIAVFGHFGHVKNFGFLKNCFWAISMTFYIILRHFQFENIKITCVWAKFGPFLAILGMFKILNFFEIFIRYRVLSVLSTTVKKNSFFIHLSIKKTKKQLFSA